MIKQRNIPFSAFSIIQHPRLRTTKLIHLLRFDPLKRHTCLFVCLCVIFFHTSPSAFAKPLIKTFSKGEVSLVLSIDPEVIDLATDQELTLSVRAPQGVIVTLPDNLADRFDGFTVGGTYRTADSTDGSGGVFHYRLTPVAGAAAYRIRPIAVTYEDVSTVPPKKGWFPTESILLDAPTLSETPPTTVSARLDSKYIMPSFRDFARITGYALLGIVASVLLLLAMAKIRLHRRLRQMTPQERAFRELRLLMDRHLPEKGLFKDFYVELTFVVRRYIERRYGIRAPERTTEEFLCEATAHEGFDRATVDELKTFLTAADLIKFAGVAASLASATEASEKAKAYIMRDVARLPSDGTVSKKEVAP